VCAGIVGLVAAGSFEVATSTAGTPSAEVELGQAVVSLGRNPRRELAEADQPPEQGHGVDATAESFKLFTSGQDVFAQIQGPVHPRCLLACESISRGSAPAGHHTAEP
jgi:hypothetical protein